MVCERPALDEDQSRWLRKTKTHANDKVARDVIEEYGYLDCFLHSTGHGVGLEIHENPSLSVKYEGKLEKGMVVTVEPGIYLEEKFGVRLEDIVLIRNKGKVLTNLSKKIKFNDY